LLLRPDWQMQVRHARQQLPTDDSPVADLITEAGGSEIVGLLSSIQRLARAGRHRTAMEEAYHALIVAPTYLPLHVTMGEILYDQGHVKEAINKFQITARTYGARKETGRAVSLYRRVIELAPMDMQVRHTLIEMLILGGLDDEAVQEFLALADTYYALVDLPKVRSTLAEARNLANDRKVSRLIRIQLFSRIGDIEMQSLEWRQALAAYEQIRTLNPEDEATRRTIVDLQFRLRQGSQAVNEISNYTKSLVESRKINQAIDFLEKLVAEYPDEPLIMRQLGDAYRQTGRKEDALARYDAAAEEFLLKNNRKAAVETIMAILSLNPPNAAEYQQMLSQLR
jgi:tetratricopeptide (TPR) repeat protein